LEKLEAEQAALTKQVGEFVFYMRGDIPYDQAWNVSPKEYEIHMESAKQRFQSTIDSKIVMH
jgi:hypothetical protein